MWCHTQTLIRYLILTTLLAGLAACSSTRHIPQPVLERDNQTLPAEAVALDLRTCRQQVHQAASMSIQPRWLPPLGVAPNGVVLGTVDVPHQVWPSVDAYRREVELCLASRGYTIKGWQ